MLIPILATMRRRPPHAEIGNAVRCDEGTAKPVCDEGTAKVSADEGSANDGGCCPVTT